MAPPIPLLLRSRLSRHCSRPPRLWRLRYPRECTSEYTFLHIVGDLIGLLEHFNIGQVFLVGHDWGAAIAWAFALFRPDKVKALVALSVPFAPRDPLKSPVLFLKRLLGDDFYVCRFLEYGEMEKEFASMGTANIFKLVFSIRKPRPLLIPKGTGLKAFDVPDILPGWLFEEDLTCYAEKFGENGFEGGLNYYRAIEENWELTAPWTGSRVEVPSKFIVGKLDFVYHIPFVKEYVHEGGFKMDVPKLEEVVVIEQAGHFVNQEKPEEVNKHIYDFIKNFC